MAHFVSAYNAYDTAKKAYYAYKAGGYANDVFQAGRNYFATYKPAPMAPKRKGYTEADMHPRSSKFYRIATPTHAGGGMGYGTTYSRGRPSAIFRYGRARYLRRPVYRRRRYRRHHRRRRRY